MAFTSCIHMEPNREMTVEEFRAWLRRYDMDHDGKINREELAEALRSLRIWFGWWKAREGIKAADSDGNGYINNSKEIEKLVKYAQKNLHMKITKNSWISGSKMVSFYLMVITYKVELKRRETVALKV
ncbi:hypothetical protein ACET3Z_011095 [Daucus carota]